MTEIKEAGMGAREETEQFLMTMLTPLENKFNNGCTGLMLGENTAHYATVICQMEGMLRTLFGIVPYMAGGGVLPWWDKYVKGIENATDPNSNDYWGEAAPYDQRMVEMTAIALGMLLTKKDLWDALPDSGKKQLGNWLLTINNEKETTNNWAFFVLFVNEALNQVGFPYRQEKIDMMILTIENCYLDDGWYSDGSRNGINSEQRDYYVAFAMHYYSLIYAEIVKNTQPELSRRWKGRSEAFARDFIYWFSDKGDAIPFGRSLTYRMAMGAFWGALAFAGVEAFPWGVMKGIYMRHLRWWMKQDLFNSEGVLTVGYTYPNLKASEYYNSAGSPYWAFKIFLPLALPADHPFWVAKELEMPPLNTVCCQSWPHMILCREHDRSHVFALASGQYAAFQPTFMAAKYEKFAYSTEFAFSVPSGEYGLEQGAFDSALALCEDDNLFRVRRKCKHAAIYHSYLYSEWNPWADVAIQTWLIPCIPWHVRIHRIISGRKLHSAEGGFAINKEDPLTGRFYEQQETYDESGVFVELPIGISVIVDLLHSRKPVCLDTAPNTNLLYPRAKLPMLQGEISIGETILACAVLGQPYQEGRPYAGDQVPKMVVREDGWCVSYDGNSCCGRWYASKQTVKGTPLDA